MSDTGYADITGYRENPLMVRAAELQVGDVIGDRTISSIQRNAWGYDVNFLGYSEAGPQWFDYSDAVKIQRPWQR